MRTISIVCLLALIATPALAAKCYTGHKRVPCYCYKTVYQGEVEVIIKHRCY